MRVTDDRLARLLDSGALTAEVRLWRGTGIEATSIEDIILDLRDARLERAGMREYLHDICDAYEAWKKNYNPDTNDGLCPDLQEAIETACAARQEP